MLVKLALNLDGNVPHNIQLAAARDILDRNGVGNTQQLEVLLKPWEQDIEGILVDGPTDDDVVDAEIVDERELTSRPIPHSDENDRLPALVEDPPRNGRGNRLQGR